MRISTSCKVVNQCPPFDFEVRVRPHPKTVWTALADPIAKQCSSNRRAAIATTGSTFYQCLLEYVFDFICRWIWRGVDFALIHLTRRFRHDGHSSSPSRCHRLIVEAQSFRWSGWSLLEVCYSSRTIDRQMGHWCHDLQRFENPQLQHQSTSTTEDLIQYEIHPENGPSKALAAINRSVGSYLWLFNAKVWPPGSIYIRSLLIILKLLDITNKMKDELSGDISKTGDSMKAPSSVPCSGSEHQSGSTRRLWDNSMIFASSAILLALLPIPDNIANLVKAGIRAARVMKLAMHCSVFNDE